MSYRISKGVFDILPHDPDPAGRWRESYLWHYLENTIRELAAEFGYQEIRTPLFESTDLFTRSVGATSDIVGKEMYTFHDKGGRSLTLRPEGTAPVMRAFIEKNLHQHSPIHKFFYLMPMFRYERSQAGRYRQHHQFGVEAIGSGLPLQDVEAIHLLWTFYQRLGLKGILLHLNSIGDAEARDQFRVALRQYLEPHFQTLSSDSQERFATNPLRILDSKDPGDQKILHNAPSISDFLSAPSKEHFKEVCSLLQEIGIPYQINHRLVRGLDYYNNTVFEITAGELGAQNSIGGGGRYDGLLQELGGPSLPSFGFGCGLERVIQTMIAQDVPIPIPPATQLFLIPVGHEAAVWCFKLMCRLREEHLKVEMDFSGKKLKQALRYASDCKFPYVAIIGEDEFKSGQIVLKEMATGHTQTLPIDRLAHAFQAHT